VRAADDQRERLERHLLGVLVPGLTMALLVLSDLRACKCPSCGQPVYLNRDGCYRRHFADEPDGRRHLCAASLTRAVVLPRALRRLDL
jgi:hypothetical protein